MSNFVKIYTTILDSSVWEEELHVRVVWVAMCALADPRGMVEASVTGLTRRANVTREQCDDALERLSSPDPDSKTPDNEGRRIQAVPGGWHILNYRKYRDRNTSTERVRDWRAKRKADSVTGVTDETASLPLSSSLEVPEKGKGKRDVTHETLGNGNGAGGLADAELVQRIRGLAVKPPQGAPVIPLTEVEKLGSAVLRVFRALGGSSRFLEATGKDYSFLVREFGKALAEARRESQNGGAS